MSMGEYQTKGAKAGKNENLSQEQRPEKGTSS